MISQGFRGVIWDIFLFVQSRDHRIFLHYICFLLNFKGEFDEEGDQDEPMIMQPIEDFEEEIVGDDDDYETGNGT